MSCTGCGEEVYAGQPCACYRKETAALEAENERLRAALQDVTQQLHVARHDLSKFVKDCPNEVCQRTVRLARGEEASSG